MKIELNGQMYDVRFEYDDVTNAMGRSVEKTTCVLSSIDPTKVGPEKYTPIFTDSVTRNVKDPSNRPLARKIAFSRVIEKLLPGVTNKSRRAKVWEQISRNDKTLFPGKISI